MIFEFSSGGVIYKKTGTQIRWLITHSSSSKMYPHNYWRLPKGWLDDENGQTGPLASGKRKATENELQKSALREVREEAGVDAKIIKKIGTYKIFFTKGGKKCLKFVTYYLMEWKKDLLEGFGFETSEVGWFSLKDAKVKLKHKNEKAVLEKASEILGSETSSEF